ncbi:hypothetical protein VOLCADRAFT_104408 [Volvox carteri f. nagariensis]|uniref:Ribonuclease n=1 Tax=Volvox carteri f. nagariensis TaxID=3068 RepID=D8TTG4_VOLCA|nr:uncharacterized protein VOLCADRAFT_104408 [Volvox carteri f. nagariensis]EFJ49302.1 hypothetical protein VOLCADRAFT_104408 [Volvox carteri f. nagariensis]|eukprot:XP_002949750.1 hypothetical protein VOLCADRAFT_104408 [Volvox carteri f. nagariensis]
MGDCNASSRDFSCVAGTRVVSQVRGDEDWIRSPCILGVDEAGRGPVLGPMVYASAFCPLSSDISGRGYADSKTLTHEAREKLFRAIDANTSVGWVAHIMSAQHISHNMLGRDKVSLNSLAFDATCHVIRTALESGASVKQVYVDTVGDADRHSERLSRAFPGISFTVCPKADSLYPIVSAASIIAKVIRDKSLIDCRQALGLQGEVGTGYPGDATTVAWLKEHIHPVLGFPPLVRHSWETCARMLEPPEAISVNFEADDAADGLGTSGSSQQRLNFVRPGGAGVVETSGLGRHTFFRSRKLQRVAEAF